MKRLTNLARAESSCYPQGESHGHRTTFRALSVSFLIAIALAGLIGSVALSTRVRAFSNTIQVTTTADTASHDSQCSLREAIINYNDNAATYTECVYPIGPGSLFVAFSTALGTATITLASPLPAITHIAGLTINGGGRITISGNNAYRVFIVNSGVPFTLDSLTVANGRATSLCSSADDGYGGRVRNDGGTLTIQNSTLFMMPSPTPRFGSRKIPIWLRLASHRNVGRRVPRTRVCDSLRESSMSSAEMLRQAVLKARVTHSAKVVG